ncbi:MAG: methyl-accepting chemotaxis protein [Sporomusaceae bacterium]|nr:methyl-accepting chemotaxis protein [Sporomusaceae bacterium]
MKLKTKITAFFLFVALVATLGFAYTIWNVAATADSIVLLKERDIPRQMKNQEVAQNAIKMVAQLRGYALTNNQGVLEDYRRLAKENDVLEDELMAMSSTPEGKKMAAEIKTLDNQYSAAADKAIVLIQQGKKEELTQLMATDLAPRAAALFAKIKESQDYRSKQIVSVMEKDVSEAEHTKYVALICAAFTLILAILVGLYAAHNIVQPILAVVAFSKELAAGDFRDKPRKVTRRDELGEMANALADMRTQVRQLLQKISQSAQQVAASSEELTASSNQSAQAATQVAVAITNVADGAAKQLTAAHETTSVVQNMSAGMEQISGNVNQASGAAADVAVKAQRGNEQALKTVDQIKRIEATVGMSEQLVTKLGERSKDIGQIVDTISTLAGQTNLLALNAAIEAARAGEQGKGFAVVAEEVRKLAEQSQEASKKISSLIQEIQSDTDQAVFAMQQGSSEVRAGAVAVNESGEAFADIAALVANVSKQVQEISSSMEYLAGGSRKIVVSVEQIDILSKHSSSETQNVSAATEEQSASMEEIASASQVLADLAQELQTAVVYFKL